MVTTLNGALMTRRTRKAAGQTSADATSQPPFPYRPSPAPGKRRSLSRRRPTTPAAQVITPADVAETLPAVLHGHGGGWIFGKSAHTIASCANSPPGSTVRWCDIDTTGGQALQDELIATCRWRLDLTAGWAER